MKKERPGVINAFPAEAGNDIKAGEVAIVEIYNNGRAFIRKIEVFDFPNDGKARD